MSKFIALLVAIASVAMANLSEAQSIEPPPSSPAPTSTASGGTRPIRSCVQSSPKTAHSLFALLSHQILGFTRSSRPTIFIYLPQTSAKSLELSLLNEQGKGLYQTTLAIQDRPGLIGVPLPKDAPELVKGKNYYWTVALICDESDRTEDHIISGWIQYRDFAQNVAHLLPLERIRIYTQQGFWYDAFQEWSTLHQQQPNHPSVKKSWLSLLEAIGLPASLRP